MTKRDIAVRATAYDVARLAGVSQSAVSRAFTDGASISDAAREKVHKAARTLGYRPNRLARSLLKSRSGIVGVVVGNLENQFFSVMLDHLSACLAKEDLQLLLFTSETNADADSQVDLFLHYRVDAVILMAARMSSSLAGECRRAGVPIVLVNRTLRDNDTMFSVTGDNVRGGAEIARYLLQQGRSKTAFIAGFADSSTSRERREGFLGHLLEQGAPSPIEESGFFTRQGAIEATRRLLSTSDPPDAIFCANDHMALGAIDVARQEFGRTIGRDLAIVGFDNIPMASWAGFDLTTFSQPVSAMAESAVEFVLHGDDMGEERRHAVLAGELIVRGSA